MGLDLVEVVMAVEDTFGVAIDDRIAEQLVTPGLVIDHLYSVLPQANGAGCAHQQAFHLTRRELIARFGVKRAEVGLATPLTELLGREGLEEKILALCAATGARRVPRFRRWLRREDLRTVRDLVGFVLTSGRVTWTRAEIARLIKRIVLEQTGLKERDYAENAHFINDLGLG